MNITLSHFLPKDTEYFYSYPSGEDSSFFNSVSPDIEELVAARLLTCAGPSVKVVVFAATEGKQVKHLLDSQATLPDVKKESVITLPASISTDLYGNERNQAIQQALKEKATPGKLIMAQPFLDEDLAPYYQIDPRLSVWLNDKQNMQTYIPEHYIPERCGYFTNGRDFAQSQAHIPLPAVVKVSSSSSGDGVYICHDEPDLEHAKLALRGRKGSIFVEQYIETHKNFGIQFGIPYDPKQEIMILGFNQQIISSAGEFLGGMIDSPRLHPELAPIYQLLQKTILPAIRAKGWYGVGGFDCLIDPYGNFFFVDCNFRATGMTAYILMARNGIIKQPLVSFSGTFSGTEREFRTSILSLASHSMKDRLLTIISLTKQDGIWRLNASLQFANHEELASRARMLLSTGLQSPVLQYFAEQQSEDVPHFRPRPVAVLSI